MVYTLINNNDQDPDTQDDNVKPADGGRFWNLDLELQALKTILAGNIDWSAKVYGACQIDYFHHSTSHEVFNRIQALMEKSSSFNLPSLPFILSDSKLSQQVKQDFSDAITDSSVVQTQGDFDILIHGLATLAKARSLYNITRVAADNLLQSEEPTALVKQVSEQLGRSIFSLGDDTDIITQLSIGRQYNQEAEDAFNRILNGSFEQTKIKSGFAEFDHRTGGFHRTNLVIIGGNSGGGKSLMAVNLLIRQYRLGYNVCLCSYEMTDDEVLLRVLANISEVDMSRLQNHRLTPIESDRVAAAWREFNLIGYKQNNTYHILCPKTETTVPEIGFRVQSLKPDMLILDYINLLSSGSAGGDAQWQQLGDISRSGKLLANKLNCVVVLLAQIDDTYNLRYSKSIKDHANFVMGWVRDTTAVNSGIINIRQLKARNAPLYDFNLIDRFDIAQFRDEGQEDRRVWPTRDELLMLEIQCHKLGLKLEPTVSKEYDKQKSIEGIQKSIVEKNQIINNISDEDKNIDVVVEKERVPTSELLFSLNDAIPKEFASLEVKASNTPLIKGYFDVEDTV